MLIAAPLSSVGREERGSGEGGRKGRGEGREGGREEPHQWTHHLAIILFTQLLRAYNCEECFGRCLVHTSPGESMNSLHPGRVGE